MDLFEEFKELMTTLRESNVDYVILDVLHVTPALEEFWERKG